MKILIVDDDPVARIFLEEALHSLGYESYVFASGQLALKFLEQSSVDLAIIDTYMPEMTGIELLQELQKSPKTAQLKTILMSADEDCMQLLKDANLKVQAVLLKPIKINNLRQAINACTGGVDIAQKH